MDIGTVSAIVTGGASGLGAATVKMLLGKGAKVTIFDLDEKSGTAYAKQIGATFVAVNVTDASSVSTGLAIAQRHQGVARILVNCAGIMGSTRLLGLNGPHSLQAFQRVINVNLAGSFNMIRLATEQMSELSPLAEGERGVCINTASISGYEGQIGQVAYSAAKAGVIGMTLTIARELSDMGIRCNSIAPGVFETAMVATMPQAVKETLISTIPFPKREGHPHEFAHLVCTLCENMMLNGETIRLDGAVRFQPR